MGTGVGLGTGVGVTDGVGAGTAVAGAVGTNVACSTGAAAGVEEGSLPTRNHHASRPIPAAAAAALTTRSNRALLDTVAKATTNCVQVVGPLTASEGENQRLRAVMRQTAVERDTPHTKRQARLAPNRQLDFGHAQLPLGCVQSQTGTDGRQPSSVTPQR